MATTVTLKPNAIDISGSTSGTTTLQATAVAGTTTLTLPAATDTLVGKATTDTLTNKTLTGAVMNGTLGATTPSTVAATSITASTTLGVTGVATFSAGTAALPAITTTGDTNTGIFFPAADTIAFAEGGVEAMRIDSSGNLGIGTSSPNTKLTVGTPNTQTVALSGSFSGVTPAIATGIGMVTVNSTDTVAVDKGGVLSFTANTTTLNGYAMGFIAGKYETAGAGVYSGYLQFGTSNSAGTIAERMRIDSSGNVGIGTTSPTAVFANYKSLYLNGSSGSAIQMQYGGSLASNIIADSNALYLQNITAIQFGTGGTGTGTERARIDSSGNLLVASTDTSLTSGVGFKFINGASSNAYMGIVNSGTDIGRANYHLYSTGAGAYRFYVTMAGVINATSTSITAISDQRLKENIRNLDIGLSEIMALKPRKFDWKEGKGLNKKDDFGFIAQEFETVFPNSVTNSKAGEDGIEYKAINHSELIPTLVKAIQEQQALITSLTARITALEQA